jgi:hypothetical protein
MSGLTDGVNGNLVGTTAAPIDPLLGDLTDNGGPTRTMALLFGSPAIDAGNDAVAPETDQRGVARPQDPASDIGAFELVVEPVDLLNELREDLLATMPPSYYRSQLLGYVDQALLWESRGDDRRAAMLLDQFIARVTIYRGSVIPSALADDYIALAEHIKAELGYGPVAPAPR